MDRDMEWNGALWMSVLPASELQVCERDTAQSGAQHHEEDSKQERGPQPWNTGGSNNIISRKKVNK